MKKHIQPGLCMLLGFFGRTENLLMLSRSTVVMRVFGVAVAESVCIDDITGELDVVVLRNESQ